MKTVTLLVCVLLFGHAPTATRHTWIFRGSASGVTAVGYLETHDGKEARGEMWFVGSVVGSVRLAGLNPPNSHGWFAERGNWSLLFHPSEPWVLGSITWTGDSGVVDFLDVGWARGEIPVIVEDRSQ